MKQFYFSLLFLFFGHLATANVEEAYACPVVNQNLQVFCEKPGPTVANLVATDQGGGVAWFSTSTSTTALAAGTSLVHGASYYAGAADGSCSSGRAVVTVEIADAPNAGSHLNLTFYSNDPPVDLFSLIGSNAYGPPDPGGVMDPLLRSGTTLFDPSLDGAYSGRRRFYYRVSSQNETCTNSAASIYITINPQANSSHRLIHYGDTPEDAYYNQNNYTPASADEGILFNIWGDGPLDVGSVYKIEMNGLERYYYVNNVYSAPELSPMYTLPADTPIEKFIVTDPNSLGRTAYAAPVLTNENYVYSRSPQIPVVDIGALKYTDEVIENITYFDGLGRGRQAIAIRAGGNQEDVITPMEYDQFGRSAREFLPYARNTLAGEMHPEVIEAERIYGTTLPYVNFYHTLKYDFTLNPYSEKEFEASPLNRVLKQAAPGEDWKLGGGQEIEFAYQANGLDEVRLFKVEFPNGDPGSPVLAIAAGGYYAVGQLYKTITRDENHSGNTKNHTTEEFKDKQGRIVLKRTYADMDNKLQEPHDTYYVYDDYGNLTFVLPPEMNASDALTVIADVKSDLPTLGYQYKYDHRNRLIEKKIPGKGWEYIIYNKLDQPILTQDALLRDDFKWLYTKFDAFGRVTSTGIYTDPVNTQTQTDMQAIVDSFYGSTTPPKQYEEKSGSIYTNRSFPTTGTELLTENFYDDYNFASAGLVVPTFNNYGIEIRTDRTRGLATGSRVKVLETSQWITIVTGYDKKGLAVWTASKNEFLGTDDVSHSDFDFVGKLRAQTNLHTKAGQTITTEDLYSYDHMGRQLSHTQSINGGGSSELLARNKYDELGVLIRKSVGGSVSNQSSIPVAVATQFDELVHLEVRENGEIHKISGGTSEAGIAKTTETIKGDGYLEFSPMSLDKLFRVGLTFADPSHPNYGFNYFAYVVGGYIKINEGGSNLEHNMDYQVNVQPGDRLTVEREGSTILYKKNGETYYISHTPAYGTLQGSASIRTPGPIMHYMKIVDLEENESPLQTINYAYNVRGWLKKINEPENLGKDLFGFEINYNDPRDPATTKLYNGNISETHWNTKSENNTNNPVSNQYTYSYDALNRIIGAIDNTTNYSLGGIRYDKMGNILSLQRQGYLEDNVTPFGPMDNLGYTYDGNQLVQVDDASNRPEGFKDGNSGVDYAYDITGNLTSDLNKGITAITYNYLNLPELVTIGGQIIKYTYDATGLKLKKEIPGKVTEYAGNFVYESNVLQFFNHPEGYLSYDGGQFNYVYNYKDHLGNIRLTYADGDGNGSISASTEILDEKNYYPFGGEHAGYNTLVKGTYHPYGFNGKEEQDEFGLQWMDFGARNYDKWLGRWMNLDPLSEKFYEWSPYNGMMNNPIFFIDPDGRQAMAPIYDTDGAFLGTDDQGLQGKAIVMDKKDFKQGMSHDKALTKSKGAEGLSSKEAGSKLLNHYNGLKDRPDYDGILTFAEVTKWSNEGSGGDLFVDASKINLNSINTSVFDGKKNSLSIDFFGLMVNSDTNQYPHPETGPVYGHIQVTLFNPETGAVKLGFGSTLLDEHDFANPTISKINDYLYPGTPKDFNIYCAPCTSKIRTAAEVKQFRQEVNKVMSERPKY